MSVRELLKAYVEPKDNTLLTNLTRDGILETGTASLLVDLVKENSAIELITTEKTGAMVYPINIYDLIVELMQLPEGEEPTVDTTDIGKFKNKGYNINLQSLQIYSLLTNEAAKSKEWDNELDIEDRMGTDLGKKFASALWELAVSGMAEQGYSKAVPVTGKKPYNVVHGFIDMMKHAGTAGYFIDNNVGSCGKFDSYDNGTAAYLALKVIMEGLLEAHDDDWADREGNCFMMSRKTAKVYRTEMSALDNDVKILSTGKNIDFDGYPVRVLPKLLKHTATGGVVIFGDPKAMYMVLNVTNMSMVKDYKKLARATWYMFDVKVAFAIIPQFLSIAYKNAGESDDASYFTIDAPTLYGATVGVVSQYATLSWSEVEGADGYILKWSVDGGGYINEVDLTDTQLYKDFGSDAAMIAKVVAYKTFNNVKIESKDSNLITFTTSAPA